MASLQGKTAVTAHLGRELPNGAAAGLDRGALRILHTSSYVSKHLARDVLPKSSAYSRLMQGRPHLS